MNGIARIWCLVGAEFKFEHNYIKIRIFYKNEFRRAEEETHAVRSNLTNTLSKAKQTFIHPVRYGPSEHTKQVENISSLYH